MIYISKNETCDHCNKHIDEVEVIHGFVYDFFNCPHCNKENKRE